MHGSPLAALPFEVVFTMTERERSTDPALAQWMRAYQEGDTAAFGELYTHLAPRLEGYFRTQTRGAGVVQDLVQETFLAVHRARHTYDPALPLEPWLFAIARYVFLMHCRTQGRRERRELAVTKAGPAALTPSPEAAVEHRDLLAQLLPQTSRPGRAALVLHHLAGLDFHEVGKRLGLSVGAARVRASRALAELRRKAGGDRPDA